MSRKTRANDKESLGEVRARRLVLVDGAGKECAVLKRGRKGVQLLLKDRSGIDRLMLQVSKDGPRVELRDRRGDAIVVIYESLRGNGISVSSPLERDKDGLPLADYSGATISARRDGVEISAIHGGFNRAGLAATRKGPEVLKVGFDFTELDAARERRAAKGAPKDHGPMDLSTSERTDSAAGTTNKQ
ncbi:MAG: hypothetical protein FJ109_20240 [Deltaproteobacteria bacterium]|nr:hypothetical protein [Deltaproteobacteria bacterium]